MTAKLLVVGIFNECIASLIKYSLNESYNEDLARIEKLNEKGFKKTKNFYSDTCKRLKNEIF